MSDIEGKQNYLRTNIIDKGFDPDEFTSYLSKTKGGEDVDIETWNFSDLKICVKEFIAHHKPTFLDEKFEDNKNVIVAKAQSNQDPKQIDTKPNLPVSTNSIPSHIKCLLIEPNDLSKSNEVTIQLSFPEKIEATGLFGKSYVTYLVTTMPFSFRVRKRYSDFEWLSTILQTLYIGSIIPPMPKKNFGDQFKESFISKRMRTLEKFMQTLILDPLLKSSPIVYDFLTIELEADFNAKRNAYNKLHSPLNLKEIKSTTGEINIKISGEQETYFANIKDNANINEALLKKISMAYKILCDQMMSLSQQMKDISGLWADLFKTSEQYADNQNLIDSYKVLSKLMNDWSDSQRKQSTLVSLDIREYFKFIKNEFRSLKFLISKVDLNKSAYYSGEERLSQKKEGLYKRGDITKWELDPNDMENKQKLLQNKESAFVKMLPRDSKHVFELKLLYGYYLNQIIDEYQRMRDMNGARHKQKIFAYAQSHSGIIAELHVTIADLISYFTEVGFKSI